MQAQAREQAARADANAERTRADAEAYRIEKESRAQAHANRELAGSITGKLLHYNQIERWNGAYPHTLMSDEAPVLLELAPGTP